ncbi:MAG: hypothetical protein U9O50_08365 [Acidobacteriota bacterium]|nr:hypothetical protein [Acidobacteriota bacterium]
MLTLLLLIVAVITYLEVRRQRRKLKPIVTVDEEDGVLEYKNIGDNSAFDIQTEEVNLNLSSIFFSSINLLQPNDPKLLESKVTARNSDAEHYLGVCEDHGIKLFPYFEGLKVHWYSLVTHYRNIKGKKYISVVLVRCETKKIEHKLQGRKWWINMLDKFKLIRNFPKPPKDAHLFLSD